MNLSRDSKGLKEQKDSCNAGGGAGLGNCHPGLPTLDGAQPADALPLEHRDAVWCALSFGLLPI